MSVSGERVAHPVRLSSKPLGVEENTGVEEDKGKVPGGLELERVVVVREIGLPEPARRRGAVSLGE